MKAIRINKVSLTEKNKFIDQMIHVYLNFKWVSFIFYKNSLQ